MEPIIIREDLIAPDGTHAPLRIVVYDRYSRFLNSMHSLVSPAQDHKWYVIAEVGAELSTQDFFGGPMAVFEGITWTRHTMDEDYQPLVDELRGRVTEYLDERFPADGVRKDRFADFEPVLITPMPVDFVQALHDELSGMPEEEFSDPLPFDGPVQDDADDSALLGPLPIPGQDVNAFFAKAVESLTTALPTLPPFTPGPLKFFDDSSFNDDDAPSSGINLTLAMIPDDSPLATASYEERKAAVDPEKSFYENRKATLGAKRAGRFIALQRWHEKRKKAAAAADVIDLNQAGGNPLVSINSQMVNMTFDGPTDAGALHRAIVIARDLCRLGHWDGKEPIRIADPYGIYNRVDQFVTCGYEAEYGEIVVRKAEKPE